MAALQSEISTGGVQIAAEPRSNWNRAEVAALLEQPFNDLLYAAQWVHRQHFDPNAVQVSTLL